MIKSKTQFVEKLVEETGRPEAECIIINSILDDHFIIGHNNKDKIKKDFIDKLSIDEEEANKLYNTCAELIVKGIFRK